LRRGFLPPRRVGSNVLVFVYPPDSGVSDPDAGGGEALGEALGDALGEDVSAKPKLAGSQNNTKTRRADFIVAAS